MSLKENLKKSLVEAMKAKDQVWLDTIRAVQSAVRYKEIEKKGELTEPEIHAVIKTLCKQRRESVEQFQKGGRTDLAEKESRELGILEKYLPAQIGREQVEAVVRKIVEQVGAQGSGDLGKVMKLVMAELAGQADGRVVNEVVKEILK